MTTTAVGAGSKVAEGEKDDDNDEEKPRKLLLPPAYYHKPTLQLRVCPVISRSCTWNRRMCSSVTVLNAAFKGAFGH